MQRSRNDALLATKAMAKEDNARATNTVLLPEGWQYVAMNISASLSGIVLRARHRLRWTSSSIVWPVEGYKWNAIQLTWNCGCVLSVGVEVVAIVTTAMYSDD
jgi:hypothetical protein